MLQKVAGCVTVAVLMAPGELTVVGQTTTSQDNLQKTLVAHETELLKAIEARNRPEIAKLLADQVMSITVERGRQTMEDQITTLASLRVTNCEMSEAKTIQVTPDVAVLTYKFSWNDVGSEKPAAKSKYSTIVFKHVNGKWSPVFYQETPVAK